jgi:hypothetical protein
MLFMLPIMQKNLEREALELRKEVCSWYQYLNNLL